MTDPNTDREEVEALVEENRKAFLRAKRLLLAMKQRSQHESQDSAAQHLELRANAGRPTAPDEGWNPSAKGWLNFEDLATVELASTENPADFRASTLWHSAAKTWRPNEPGRQIIRLDFEVPQSIRKIRLVFIEQDLERTQEFVLRWRPDRSRGYEEIVRQQYVFSPGGSTREVEEYQVDLKHLVSMELAITPDLSGRTAFASLSGWGLATAEESQTSFDQA